MRREMRVLQRAWRGQELHPSRLILSGVGPYRASEAAEALVRSGCRGLVSIGLAGGLDPALRCGDVLVPRRLMLAGGVSVRASDSWRDSLLDALAVHVHVCDGDLVTVSRAVATARGKAQLAKRTGAAAVDMEAAAVARVGARHGCAVLALKVIVDIRDHSLPEGLERALDEYGGVRAGALGRALLGSPGLLTALPGLARACRIAESVLYALAARIGPGLRLSEAVSPGSDRERYAY